MIRVLAAWWLVSLAAGPSMGFRQCLPRLFVLSVVGKDKLRNLVQVAELIVRCAMMRKESRGLHFTLDYPELLTHSGPSILSAGNHYINR